MQMVFEAVAETRPGPRWQALFNKNWPDYRAWWLARRGAAGPSLDKSVQQLRRFMPELLPTYQRLVELAGGDQLAARFLTGYRPPPYLLNCSQAVWSGPDGPVLARNYDLDPRLSEGVILHSQWHGRKVIASNECLWGVDDGLNDAGLALSVTFGGRQVVGDGFGIPVILRYILECCATTAEAVGVLRRVPSHMAYNVTVADRRGDYATALVAPDRSTVVTRKPVATNHQGAVEWTEHGRFSRTLERERFLTEHLKDARLTEPAFIAAFLQAPLYNRDYRNGFGTLYTAVYRPVRGEVEFRWPDGAWVQSLDRFQEGERTVKFSQITRTAAGKGTDKATPRPDTAWAFHEGGAAGILKQTVKTVLDTLDTAGIPMAAKIRGELLEELERTGQVPWHRLGMLWAGVDPERT